MKAFAWLRSFASAIFRRSRFESDMDEELRAHIQDRANDWQLSGLSRTEAERLARLDFGGYQKFREECREATGAHFVETFVQDVRHGLRMLRKSPGFTTVAVLTLALGIGANTAIFSLVDCIVLRPLPVNRPGQLVFLTSSWKGGGSSTAFSYPDFRDIQDQTRNIFSEVTAIQPFQMDGLSGDGKSQPMWVCYVTGNFFDALGIKPALGRFTLPSEGSVVGADPVLVISYADWKARFNRDPNIAGTKMTVNGHPVTLVGVAPEGFRGVTSLLDSQGYMPLGMAPTLKDAPPDILATRSSRSFGIVARLQPGVDILQAQSALQVVAKRMSQEHSNLATLTSLRVIHLGPAGLAIDPGHPEVLALVSILFLSLAASVLVLACVNIANLLLVRAGARQREMALRRALGATRSRLIRHLLTESILLAALGGIAGILLGLGASRLVSSIPLHVSLPVVLDFRFDWRVFAYGFAAAFLTGILAGIVPALRAARGNVNEILRDGGRTSTPRNRLRSALVAAQVGSSLTLLVVAGLFVRSLEHVQHSDLGFDPKGVLNATFDPHEAGYDRPQAQEFFRSVLQSARSLPGVQSASLALSVPMSYYTYDASLTIPGYQPPLGEGLPRALYNAVSPGYFETMGISLVRGRDFLDSDRQGSSPVAVITQKLADKYWPGEDPVGRQFSSSAEPDHSLQIVGVVRNIQSSSFEEEPSRFFYIPLAQASEPGQPVTLQIRTTAPAETMLTEITGLIRSIDPAMPVTDVQRMTAALNTLNGLLPFQLAAGLAACLGILGLLLAVVGVYGVISYAASQRTHEIGIRLALGAQTTQILGMILSQGMVIVGAGVLVGLAAAGGMAKLVGNFLIGVGPLDPATYLAALLVLAVAALAACYIPARRGMRVDPMVALRYE